MTALFVLCSCLVADAPGDSSARAAFPAKLTRQATLATVQVVKPGGAVLGSGVLIKHHRVHVYVLTAAHVVTSGDRYEVHVLVPGKPAKKQVYRGAEVLARSAAADVAVLRLTTTDKLPQPLPLCPPEQSPKTPPASTLNVGWAGGDAPTAEFGAVKRKVLVRRPGETTSSWNWETSRRPVPGRSGGPLVDAAGQVIGVASGHDGTSGYYIHPEEIHRFLKRNALGWLADKD